MKRSLKIILMAICLAAFMAPAFADNDKPIQVKELPAKAQTILSQHFKNQKVALATIEVGLLEKNYDVVLNNGTKVEFDKNGNVTEVECKQEAVPTALIPKAINTYLQQTYPEYKVRKYEMKRNEYEVELNNGLEITFNKDFQVIDID